jgi:hypothetical protein
MFMGRISVIVVVIIVLANTPMLIIIVNFVVYIVLHALGPLVYAHSVYQLRIELKMEIFACAIQMDIMMMDLVWFVPSAIMRV